MVGLIFSIVLLIACSVIGGLMATKTETNYREDRFGDYVKDENGNRIKDVTHPLKKYAWLVTTAGVVLCVILIFLSCIANVGTGKTGVVTTFGKIENYTLDSGFHFKAPWNSVTQIDTTVNEVTIETPAYTNDSQTVDLAMTVQYRISTTDTFSVVADNGINNTQDILEGKLENRIMTAAKNIIAKKKADDLLTNRSGVVSELAAEIDGFKDQYYVIITAVNLTNIDFTDEYEAAVAAKVSQQQAYEKALIEQQQALAAAENDKKIATTNAEAEASKAKIAAEAEAEVVKIQAEAAEYQGKKEAAIVLNRLAGINGWNVITDETTGLNKLVKSNGIEVTDTERAEGVQKLIEYYYTQTWNGTLPETYVGNDSVSSILIDND